MNPEPLWDWMNGLREQGVDSLAIPHNSNISGGSAFSMDYFNGGPIDDSYAANRLLNEPLVEITQAKGTSETHPLISKNDEWAAFETATPYDSGKAIEVNNRQTNKPTCTMKLNQKLGEDFFDTYFRIS